MEYKGSSASIKTAANTNWAIKEFVNYDDLGPDYIPLSECEDLDPIIDRFITGEIELLSVIAARIDILPYPHPISLLNKESFLFTIENIACFGESDCLRIDALNVISFMTLGNQSSDSPFLDSERIQNYINIFTPSNGALIKYVGKIFFNCMADDVIGEDFSSLCFDLKIIDRLCSLTTFSPKSSITRIAVKLILMFCEVSLPSIVKYTSTLEEGAELPDVEQFVNLSRTIHVMFPMDSKTNKRICRIICLLIEFDEFSCAMESTIICDLITKQLYVQDKGTDDYGDLLLTFCNMVEKFDLPTVKTTLEGLIKCIETYTETYSDSVNVFAVANYVGQAFEHGLGPQIYVSKIITNMLEVVECKPLDEKKRIVDVICLCLTDASFVDFPYEWADDAFQMIMDSIESLNGLRLEHSLSRIDYLLHSNVSDHFKEIVSENSDFQDALESIIERHNNDTTIVNACQSILDSLDEDED